MGYIAPPGLESRVAAMVQPQVRRIARDLADNMARTAPPGAVWQTAADEKVRPSHRESEGQTIPGNLRFQLPKMQYVRGTGQYVTTSGHDLARAPRDEALPPEQKINCFTGTTQVDAVGIEASFRSTYEGPLVRVSTASGRILTGTPNHPVLTDAGWIALGRLDMGHHLVVCGIGDLIAVRRLAVGGDPQVEHLPATLSEVHAALAKPGLATRVTGVAVDFYGDRPTGDVEVVRAYGLLADSREVGIAQPTEDLVLEPAHDAGSTLRLPREFQVRGRRTASSLVRRASQALALVGTCLRHAREHRLLATTGLHPGPQQDTADWPSTDAVRSGQRLLALPCPVATDDVVRVERLAPTGHAVYTLSTDIGIYTVAGGIVAANCRCTRVELPHDVANHIRAGDPRVEGMRCIADVTVTYPRIAESEHPDSGDGGGGWVRDAVQRTASARRLR